MKKRKGSNNRNKARKRVALIHEKISNTRNDFLQKLTRRLVDESQVDIFAMEDLNVSGMIKNHHLAKSISDSSWNRFKTILIYKAKWVGKKVIEIDRFYPSPKICNVCGYKNDELTLKMRERDCPKCGTHHDRDINAAINIQKQEILKQTTVETTRCQACGDHVRPVDVKATVCETGSPAVYTTG